jgi:tetratricopeptide (TPR) repeat protein
MRFRRGLPLVLTALWGVSCTTVPPTPSSPPATIVEQEAASYRSPADAPRVLEAFDRKLTTRQQSPSELSNPDLSLYSNLLLAAGRLNEAERALGLLAERTPSDSEVLWALTLLAGARGDLATQEKRLLAFEAVAPGDPEAVGLRARILLAKGDRVGAKNAWMAVLSKREDSSALQGLAQLALDSKHPQDALPLADRAAKAAPEDDQALALRAKIEGELQSYREAKKDLDKAVALAPEDPWHRLDRGKLAFLHLYDFDLAQADLEFATLKMPGSFFGWEALAEVYEEQERPRQAYDAWMKALSLRPDYRFGYPSAAMLSFRYQDWERAGYYAHEAAKDHPAEYAFPLVEALSLRAVGRIPAGQNVLEKARPRFDRGSTVDEMFRFLLTPGSDFYFNTAMNLEKQETVRLRLRFYQGCFYALTKAPASAKAAFEEVEASTLKKIPEIAAARDWLDHGL